MTSRRTTLMVVLLCVLACSAVSARRFHAVDDFDDEQQSANSHHDDFRDSEDSACASMNSRQLRDFLRARGVPYKDLVDRDELVQRCMDSDDLPIVNYQAGSDRESDDSSKPQKKKSNAATSRTGLLTVRVSFCVG